MARDEHTTGNEAGDVDDDRGLERLESRKLPEKISSLRRNLYLKAKREPKFRFYALYDRIYRKDVLLSAAQQVVANKGSAGVDGVTIDQIAGAEAAQRLVDELHEELRNKRYRPMPVLRVMIPKADGRERPLGIPTVRDRVVQTAALMILEAIFEADFIDCSYGFRPKRSAHDALAEIRELIKSGRKTVYDADLQGYFDSIPHDKLLAAVRVRIADRSVLSLIRMWLEAQVVDRNGGGTGRQTKGTPQGGVISPLLANIFLHWFDKAFHGTNGPAAFANARLVRYADDFLVLCFRYNRRVFEWVERLLEGRFGLVINREKTRIVELQSGECGVDFLGYTFRYEDDLKGRGYKYLHVGPSKKALGRARERVREMTSARMCFKPTPRLIAELNSYSRSWSQYFSYGYPARAWRHLNWQMMERMRCHLQRRSQRPFRCPKGKSFYRHLIDLGLRMLAPNGKVARASSR